MACGREPCQACNIPASLLVGPSAGSWEIAPGTSQSAWHLYSERRLPSQSLRLPRCSTAVKGLCATPRRCVQPHRQRAHSHRPWRTPGTRRGHTERRQHPTYRCAVLEVCPAPWALHPAPCPHTSHLQCERRECVQPRSQPFRMHPRVLICLEDVLGFDVFQSPLQSRYYLIAQMPVIILHGQAHCIPKHVGCACRHLICPAKEKAVIPLRPTASEHPEPAPPEPIALRHMVRCAQDDNEA
eukprot:scaffold27425_cov69-Phaeocystis_antarctica.AAC.6